MFHFFTDDVPRPFLERSEELGHLRNREFKKAEKLHRYRRLVRSEGIIKLSQSIKFSSYAQNDWELTPRASIVILCKYLFSYGIPQNPAAKLSAEANIRSLMCKIMSEDNNIRRFETH